MLAEKRLCLLGAVFCFALGGLLRAALPIVDDADVGSLRDNCRGVLRTLEELKAPLPAETTRSLQQLLNKDNKDARAAEKIQKLLDPHCLIGVNINPESRVKAARGDGAAELTHNRATFLLIKVHNQAGVMHGLVINATEKWLDVTTLPINKKALTGHKVEYVVVKLKAGESGKREATLKFDVGQGTQDLGFRGEVPVLFTVRKVN